MSTTALNLKNIQGDILLGLQKRVEAFIFLNLKQDAGSITKFRRTLKTSILPHITTTQDVIDADANIKKERKKDPNVVLPLIEVNISFSASGLSKLGIPADQLPGKANDAFRSTQRSDAVTNLGDPVDAKTKKLTTWSPNFLQSAIDVLIIVTAPKQQSLDEKVKEYQVLLEGLTDFQFVRMGNVRPGDNAGHEHFGYLDGISQPKITGLSDGREGEKVGVVGPEVILVGQPSSQPQLDAKDAWQKDGSFLVLRDYKQLVPEFDKFVQDQAKQAGASPGLVGARIFGRWKSGAPVVLASTKDDSSLANANTFDFSDDLLQHKCPYASHIRKTNPRAGIQGADQATAVLPHLMIRSGIPYGPEVTTKEQTNKKTSEDRGLLFVCYQSSIEAGFQLVQKAWSNSVNFPPNPSHITPGFDLVIGQNSSSQPRTAQNILPKGETGSADGNNVVIAPNDFVVPRGGEYFFSPSLDALKNKLGL